MEVRKKRLMSLTVIHMFMFVSGLEYAIIFPTLWEYLQHLGVNKDQTFWLGLVISAMTVTDMISGLIIGRVVDVYNNIRLLVLGLNIFQIGGGIMYAVASCPVILFLARLLSGCGKSISVALLADLCKSTSKEERTPVLLLLNISYQVGLLLGPAMNLVLEHLDLHISSWFSVTKLNAPGLVMGLLWTLITVMVLLLYYDLVKLSSEELLSDELDQGYLSSDTMENIDLYEDESQSSRQDLDLSDEEPVDGQEQEIEFSTQNLPDSHLVYTDQDEEHGNYDAINVYDHEDGSVVINHRVHNQNASARTDHENLAVTVEINHTESGDNLDDATAQIGNGDGCDASSVIDEQVCETAKHDDTLATNDDVKNVVDSEILENREVKNQTIGEESEGRQEEEHERLKYLLLTPPPGADMAGTSNLLAIPAINCLKDRSRKGSVAAFSIGPTSSQGSGYGSTDNLIGQSYPSQISLSSNTSATRAPSWDNRVNPIQLLRKGKRKSEKFIIEAERMIADGSAYSEAEFSFRTNASSRNVSVIHSEAESVSATWTEYRHHIFKAEIFILIIIRFLVLFCQTSLEAIVPPMMNTYFQYSDLANSYLYLAAAVEFIVVFGLLTGLSRCVTDRALVRGGLVLSLVALIWHSCTIPTFSIGDRSKVVYFGVGAFLQLLGCPVVAEIGLALYSKLLPETVQGVGHGVRRFFSQLAVLLGPLWGASTLPFPLQMTLLPLFLQVGATLLFIIWYKKMRPVSSQHDRSPDENTPLLT